MPGNRRSTVAACIPVHPDDVRVAEGMADRIAEETEMMRHTTRKRLVLVAGAVALTFVAATSLAKPHDGRGPHAGKGKGEPHGKGPGSDGTAGVPQGGAKPKGPGKGACDPAVVATLEAALAATCPCAGVDDGTGTVVPWKNHGRYVRCVAHALRDQARAAGVKRRCMRGFVPCAARSTCGKGGAVTCVVTSTGTCTAGACTTDADAACTTDADCVASACAVTNADDCAALGGVAGTGSCCAASPSGAFLD